MSKMDYKQKYYEMRSKLLESTDVAYRLGYEEGIKEGQQAAMQQQMAQQQEQMMRENAMQEGAVDEMGNPIVPEEGMEGETPIEGMEQKEMPSEEMGGGEMSEEQGSELDQGIAELESLVAKGEKPKVLDLRKVVDKITNLRKSQKAQFKRNQKQIESSQKKLVDSIIQKWEKEANDNKGIDKVLEEIELDSLKE